MRCRYRVYVLDKKYRDVCANDSIYYSYFLYILCVPMSRSIRVLSCFDIMKIIL
jgi:hypothetical protein